MELIQIQREPTVCLHCQNLSGNDEYEFGADFTYVEHNDLFYIRRNIATNDFDLVIDKVFKDKTDTSCRIFFCPICGRKLV